MSTTTQPFQNREVADDLRATFRDVADVLIPAARGMPSASEVNVHGPVLDHILALRPDLKEVFVSGLAACKGRDPEAAARALNETNPKALATIGLVAAAAYYMDERIKTLIGYPGQESRSYDPDATPPYVSNGMLETVIERGPIYRPTPD
jgi:hypothetical protein